MTAADLYINLVNANPQLLNYEMYAIEEWRSGAVVSTVASQKEGSGFKSGGQRDLPVWSLHVLPVPVCFFSGYFGFIPQSKDMQVSLTGHSKLSVGVRGCVLMCVAL